MYLRTFSSAAVPLYRGPKATISRVYCIARSGLIRSAGTTVAVLVATGADDGADIGPCSVGDGDAGAAADADLFCEQPNSGARTAVVRIKHPRRVTEREYLEALEKGIH